MNKTVTTYFLCCFLYTISVFGHSNELPTWNTEGVMDTIPSQYSPNSLSTILVNEQVKSRVLSPKELRQAQRALTCGTITDGGSIRFSSQSGEVIYGCDGSSGLTLGGVSLKELSVPNGSIGATLVYEWESSSNGTSWSPLGAQTKEYSLPSFFSNTIYYRRKVRNSNCAEWQVSNVLKISIPKFKTQVGTLINVNPNRGSYGFVCDASMNCNAIINILPVEVWGDPIDIEYRWKSSLNAAYKSTIAELGAFCPSTAGSSVTITRWARERNSGCEYGESGIDFIFYYPYDPNLNIQVLSQPQCSQNNGSVSLSDGSSNAAYYKQFHKYRIKKDNGTWLEQSSGVFSGLAPGNYSAELIADCKTISGSFSLTALQATYSPPSSVPYCSDASISLNVTTTGGTAPYQYYIHRPGGGVWSDNGNLTQLYPYEGDRYDLIIKDANACQYTFSFNVPKTSAPQIGNINSTAPTACNSTDGIIQVNAGNSGQEYKLNNGIWSSNTVYGNLSAGDYTLSVRKVGDTQCQENYPIKLASSSIHIDGVILVAPTGCGNQSGRITAMATLRGSGTLQYALRPAASTAAPSWQDEGHFGYLNTGTYLLSIKSSSNCSKDTLINLVGPISPSLSAVAIPASTCTSNDGRITVSARPAGYWEYSIDGVHYQTDSIFRNLPANTYRIKVIGLDSTCFAERFVTVNSLTTCQTLCSGDSIQIGNSIFGPAPFCLLWEPSVGLANPTAAVTKASPWRSTRYRRFSMDNNGNITDSLVVDVKVNVAPDLELSPAQLNLCSAQGQTLQALEGLYSYQWYLPNGQVVAGGHSYQPTLAGVHFLRARADSLACWGLDSALVIKQKLTPALAFQGLDSVLCGDSLRLIAPNDYHTYRWTLADGQSQLGGAELTLTQPGEYTLMATYAEGCIDTASAQIIPPPFGISLEQSQDVLDIADYHPTPNYYLSLSGTGRQSLGLNNPEGKTVIVNIDKGCYDCGAVTIEVRDTLLPDSTHCQKTVRRAWIARNECGRRAVALQMLSIVDQKPPYFIDFPADSLIVTCGLPLPDETPRAADNGGRKVHVTLHNVEKIARGSCDTLLIRHWRALDSCGNDSIRKQYLLIKASPEGLLGVGNPHACGTPYQQPQLNQDLRQSLQAEDVIWMYGFPVKIWNVTGGAGTFSGNGLLTLPFQEQAVKVTFANIQVNDDGKVLAGTMQAVRAPNQVTYRCADPEEVDFCPTYTTRKDSIAAIVRQEANGFKNCLWQEKSPVAGLEIDNRYDPYGFDCKGIHRTGETTNEIGCTQSEMNDSKNDKCYGKIEPWAWLTAKDTLGVITDEGGKLAEQVKDSLRLIVTDILADLILEWEAEHRIQQIKCAGIRTETRDAFAALGLPNSTYVFGSEGQYVKEGMWRQFAGAPSVLSLSVSREDGMETLEKKHVELYPCDKKQEELKTRLSEAGGLQNEEAKGKLIQWLTEMIRRLPKDSVVAFQQNRELFKAWIKRQIAARAAQNAQAAFTNTDTPGSSSGGFHQVPAPSRGAMREEKENIDAAIAEWQQRLSAQAKARQVRINQSLVSGEEFIEGTHRAFYLQDIARQKSASFFPPDGNAKDTGAVLLPIAITKPVGGRNYTILLDNISINANTGGTLNAYLILPAPSGVGKDSVVFQALNIPFTPGGADYNNAKLTLKCEAPMRLSDIAQLKLLAGNQTYIEWDCNGFSKLNLAAEIEFCRNVLVPYDGESLQPAPDSVRLKATLSTYITAWDDFTMGVNFSHPFGLSEEGGFLFRVNDAYIDMSSTKTPADLNFPENYPFASAGDRNLWKGFYMKQFSIYLPQELDQSRAPRGLSLTDMIIDDAGVSVVASIPGPVVPLQDGNLDGWAFSIDSVLIKVLRNKFSGAGFGGLVNIPILSSATGAAISPEDCVRYTAMIEDQGRYTFSVQPATGKKIGMWFADVTIEKSSKVSVTYANRRFEAKAVLNGIIKVNAEQSAKIKIPELRFQGLTVSNTAPYFDPGTWSRPSSSAGVKADFDGFSFGVDSVNVEGGAKPGLGFRVRLSIGPENGGFAVEGGFKMKGRLDVSTGRQRWLPDGLEVKRFSVKGTIKKFISVDGFVEHFTNNAKFGNGFWGGLSAKMEFELLKGTELQAVALFGTTNTPDSTKYFMVDVMGLLPDASPGFIKGFGGGVWNRMSARDTSIVLSSFDGDVTTFPIGQSLSGLKYEPEVSAGLGLKAAMLLSLSEGKFKALVSLNAQFNAEGGLDELSLNGVGTMLKKTTLDGNVDTTDAAIRAGVRLKYSFSEKAFDGHLNVSITVPNALTGGGEAKIHFSDKKWFIHVGTPQNPIRANFQIPLVGDIGAARLYLDMGSELPPPAALPSYFRDMGIASAIMDSRSGSGGGGGVMFGVGLDLKANFDKLKPLYASMNINLGADLALIDYGNAICSTTGQPIGINGWYATGQVYAYLRASVGLKFKNKQFPIAELAVGAALQGKLPNPTFARGAVGGSYRILGGLVKGKFNLQFTLGQDCGELEGGDGTEQSLEQNYQIIAALRPDEGAVGVVTTSVPAADFRFPINSTLESFDDEGNPISYLVELDGTPQLIETVTQVAVPAVAILSADGRSLKFQPYDALKDSTRFSFIVKVKYSKNGTIIGSQEKQVSFTTGAAATNISPANISASYPISGMQHFYPGEYASEGEFIELSQGQADLFKGSNAPKAILLGATGGELWQGAVQYNLASKRVSFNFPNEILRPGQCYTLEIRRLAQPETRANDNNGGTSLPPGLLTTLNFCTSNYQIFREKATAFAQGATRTVVGNQIVLTGSTEEFDELETGASSGGTGFVALETSLYNNQWYQTQKELLYKAYRSKWGDGAFQFVPQARNGAAPDQAVAWEGGKVLQFNVLVELLADFQDFRNQVRDYDAELRSKCSAGQEIGYASSSPCGNCCVLPEFVPALLDVNTPTPPAGTYPLRLSYSVPGMAAGSSTTLSVYYGTINPELWNKGLK